MNLLHIKLRAPQGKSGNPRKVSVFVETDTGDVKAVINSGYPGPMAAAVQVANLLPLPLNVLDGPAFDITVREFHFLTRDREKSSTIQYAEL